MSACLQSDPTVLATDGFIGATDSAAPCAMLLDLARAVTPLLRARTSHTLQLVFFDGEEAFGEWSAVDSLYGSRHLAARLEADGQLGTIELMVLLDLIGAARPRFYSAYADTHAHFQSLARIELGLAKAGALRQHQQFYFVAGDPRPHGVDDDHAPFVARHVPVVHLIALPFPPVWHTDRDDAAALDADVLANLLLIFKIFVLEYFGAAG